MSREQESFGKVNVLEEAVHKFNMRLLAYCNQRFLTPLIPLTASQVSEFVLMI